MFCHLVEQACSCIIIKPRSFIGEAAKQTVLERVASLMQHASFLSYRMPLLYHLRMRFFCFFFFFQHLKLQCLKLHSKLLTKMLDTIV